MYLGAEDRGRLAAVMTRSAVALVAVFGTTAIPAASDPSPPVASARLPVRSAGLHVAVSPGSGSARTRFAVSFRAALSTEPSAHIAHAVYRVTAGTPAHGSCQAGAAAIAPAARAGSSVRVVLAPSRSAGWCAGTFRGQVWLIITQRCPAGV